MPSDGFRSIAQNPQMLDLMARIEQNVVEHEQREGPKTYICPSCLDTGVTTYSHESKQHDHCMHARPCEDCREGLVQERGWAVFRCTTTIHQRERNRLLTETERHTRDLDQPGDAT